MGCFSRYILNIYPVSDAWRKQTNKQKYLTERKHSTGNFWSFRNRNKRFVNLRGNLLENQNRWVSEKRQAKTSWACLYWTGILIPIFQKFENTSQDHKVVLFSVNSTNCCFIWNWKFRKFKPEFWVEWNIQYILCCVVSISN